MRTTREMHVRVEDCDEGKKNILRHPVFVRFLVVAFFEAASSSSPSLGGDEAPRLDAAALSSEASIR